MEGNYRKGFMGTCRKSGICKEAAETLYKEATLGKFLQQWGNFATRHPHWGKASAYLAAGSIMVPTAGLINYYNKTNADMLNVPTKTPAEQRMYDRIFHGGGYTSLGLDPSDVSNFNYIG